MLLCVLRLKLGDEVLCPVLDCELGDVPDWMRVCACVCTVYQQNITWSHGHFMALELHIFSWPEGQYVHNARRCVSQYYVRHETLWV